MAVQAPYAGNTVAYDTRGNTTSLAGETLTYDSADRHLATTKAGNTVTYHRDVLDRIVARTGTDGTTRYTYGAGTDTTAAVLDTSNLLVHTTIALPGGVLVSKAAGGETWSHPNLHGSITAITNTAGAKQGGTFHYDPYGNPTASLPDNLAGDLDYGWLGQHQRPTEHHTGLRTQTDMGARGYDPQLARFLEVDPVEGGVNNDYNYPTDPRNQYDLDGERCEGRLYDRNPNYNAFDGFATAFDPSGRQFRTFVPCGRPGSRGFGWKHMVSASYGTNHHLEIRRYLNYRYAGLGDEFSETAFWLAIKDVLRGGRLRRSGSNWVRDGWVTVFRTTRSGRVHQLVIVQLRVVVNPYFGSITTAYCTNNVGGYCVAR